MEVSETKYCSHYNNKQQILLLGEGDFSFSLCLAKAFGSATNITATSLDTPEELRLKYTNAKKNVEELEKLGCNVVYGVDVHSMTKHYGLIRSTGYDRIIFNFPHAGFYNCCEHVTHVILKHQELVRGFLKNAREMVKHDGGEIHVTHKTAHPFNNWEIKRLGVEEGLLCHREVNFYSWQYPGYSNKKGSGRYCDISFPVGECSTFMFKKP